MSRLIVTTSWDDGSSLDLKVAELLEKYAMRGTFYVPKSYRGDSLEEREIKSLDKKFEIGAHTLNHVDLAAVSLEDARKEIAGSKAYLETLLGHEVLMFCYPKGSFNEDIKGLVRDSGFIAARTCTHGDFAHTEDPCEWQISLHASNGSPRTSLRIWRRRSLSIRSLLDWEIRAKLLFDLALKKGGIYHLWGHSWEIDENQEWPKLERVLSYLSNRQDVHYMTNAEAIASGDILAGLAGGDRPFRG